MALTDQRNASGQVHSVSEVTAEEGPAWERAVLFAVFLALGLSIFAVPNFVIGSLKVVYESSLAVALGLAFFATSKARALAGLKPVMFAFFTASVAYSSTYILAHPYSLDSTVEGIAYQKVLDTVAVVVPIVVLVLASGVRLDSVMLRRGRLKLGLVVGVATFLVFALSSVQVSALLFYGNNLSSAQAFGWAPWVLLFVLPNGLREELLFRGLFLKKYQSLVGVGSANFLQALIFSSAHLGSTYSSSMALFLVITFLLGLGFGELMKRSNSLIGSALFHAGADVPIVLGYFSMVS